MIRVLCLSLLLFAFAAPAARADELQGLIDRHFAWRGGAAYERLATFHGAGRAKAAGLEGPVERWAERTGREYERFELGAFNGATAVADDSWTMEEGVVEDLPAVTVRDTRRSLALEFGEALRGGAGAKLSRLDDQARDGRTWARVRVGFGDADSYDAYIDPATGELLGYAIVTDRKERFYRLSEWRMVDGVRVPFVRELLYPNARENVAIRFDRIDINRTAPAETYLRPKTKQIASFAGGASSTGPLDFDFYNGNRIYIPVSINGTPVKVLLDSGADATVLDRALADQLGLKREGEVVATGTGGQVDSWMARGVDVKVGNMTMADRTVGIIDLADVSKRLALPLPAILGEDVFKQLVVDIDFESRKIAFHDPRAFKVPAGAIVVPVVEGEGVRTAPVSIEGRAPIQVDFDIGNGGNFLVDPAFYEKERLLLDGRPQSKILGGAVGGAREEIVTTLKSVKFAGIDFKDVPATFRVPRAGASVVDSDRSPGNIGLSILARFRLITDYSNDRLYLVPHADAQTRPFRKDRAGLQTVLEGERLKVTYASPGSPAEAGGWKAGEEIAAIDGAPVTAGFNGSELSRWRFGAAGRTVSFTLADGSKRTLVLKDYF